MTASGDGSSRNRVRGVRLGASTGLLSAGRAQGAGAAAAKGYPAIGMAPLDKIDLGTEIAFPDVRGWIMPILPGRMQMRQTTQTLH
jgi:hypothetical protein